MSGYSFASGILVFAFLVEGLSMNAAIALFLAFGAAEALSLGQRLVTGRMVSDSRLIQGRSADDDGLAVLAG